MLMPHANVYFRISNGYTLGYIIQKQNKSRIVFFFIVDLQLVKNIYIQRLSSTFRFILFHFNFLLLWSKKQIFEFFYVIWLQTWMFFAKSSWFQNAHENKNPPDVLRKCLNHINIMTHRFVSRPTDEIECTEFSLFSGRILSHQVANGNRQMNLSRWNSQKPMV